MEPNEKTRLIQQIRSEYTDTYDTMIWLTPDSAVKAEQERQELLSRILSFPGPRWDFSQTKLIAHDLSPGCALCGKGDWSCLFINNLCNARCFYCPASQDDEAVPATGRVEFPSPEAYADYVRAFGIKAVSFSGGEPLISFDKVMAFLKTLRSQISAPLYIWMYTNGILATEDKLKALADNGLDEIRFDLSANAYKMETLEKAVGIIPRVTVEIPAVPEDLEQVKLLLKRLESAGVNYLNLHQIRCTKFNRPKLAKRGYTFVHGPGVTVLETELTALRLICHALEQGIQLPINYCAFAFRSQFQKAGAQKRTAAQIMDPHETLTPTGQIRTLTLMGDAASILSAGQALSKTVTDPALWKLDAKKNQLVIHPSLLPAVDTSGLALKINHTGTNLGESVSYRHRFKQMPLNSGKTLVVERFLRHPGLVLEGGQIPWFVRRYLFPEPDPGLPLPAGLSRETADQLERFETFVSGLAPYF